MAQWRSILSICPVIPRPDAAAGDRRYFAMLELLARSNRVDLYAASRLADRNVEARYVGELRAIGVNFLPCDGLGWFNGVVRGRRYDVGLFEFWHSAAERISVFRDTQPWAKLIVDSVDVHFAREEAAARLGLIDEHEVAANRRRELDTYRSADAVIATAEDDRLLLEKAGGLSKLYTVPIVVPSRLRAVVGRRPEVLFIGGFSHAPNADGLLWFAREIWPSVLKQVPGASLTIVGSHPNEDILSMNEREGICVVGHVPDTTPYLDRAAVSIAPLRFGAGMKGKVAEALACGLPVVTTTIGAQGFGIVSGEHALVADEPEAFAAAVAKLLSDPAYAKNMGEAGQALVAGICSPEIVGSQLNRMLDQVCGSGGPSGPSLRWQMRSTVYRGAAVAYPILKRFRRRA